MHCEKCKNKTTWKQAFNRTVILALCADSVLCSVFLLIGKAQTKDVADQFECSCIRLFLNSGEMYL